MHLAAEIQKLWELSSYCVEVLVTIMTYIRTSGCFLCLIIHYNFRTSTVITVSTWQSNSKDKM